MRHYFAFAPPLLTLALFAVVAPTGCSQDQPGTAAPPPAATSTSGCSLQLTGNLSAGLTLASCGELRVSPSEAGTDELALDFQFAIQNLKSLDISLALGPSPSVGSYSSETSSEWSAVGLNGSQCRYTAGSESVPVGSYKLTLSSIEIADGGALGGAEAGMESDAGASVDAGADASGDADVVADATVDADADADADADSDTDAADDAGMGRVAGIAHGTLELTMYVLAPPATDCGVGDLENVVINF